MYQITWKIYVFYDDLSSMARITGTNGQVQDFDIYLAYLSTLNVRNILFSHVRNNLTGCYYLNDSYSVQKN